MLAHHSNYKSSALQGNEMNKILLECVTNILTDDFSNTSEPAAFDLLTLTEPAA